jgi:hypothetical protein
MAATHSEHRCKVEDEIIGLPSEGGTGKSIRIVLRILAHRSLSMHNKFPTWEGRSRLMERAELRISGNQE